MKNPKNVNVLGLLSANVGLGITARIFAKVLASHGYEVHGLDVEGDGQALKVDGMTVVRSAAELPSGVNLMVLSFDRVAPLLLRRAPELLGARFRNVGLLFWELAVIPPAWKPGMALFDGLVACSRFNQQSFEMACPDVPVTYCEHPVEKTAPLEPARLLETRRRYGIADRQFLASASFDLRSGIDRKNPFAVIETFKRAFPDDADVRLLLKAHGYEVLADRDSTRALIEAVRHDSRIVLETGSLPYIDVRALYAASDVYLSLHRSEGLGLGLMESMAEGTLVIATGYSGNVSFMTEQNSMLVPYRLVKPDSAVMATYLPSFAGRDSRWAAVDVDVAARMLRRARDDRLLRETLAARARDDIAQRQQTAWEAEALRDALRQAAAQPFDAAASARRTRRARLNEWIHPALFERNFRHAVRKLR